jgi:tRNA (adenine22-N1)-methyltransferase
MQKTMLLSKRLQAVADLVTPGNRVADVGCDHAYTAIYLVKNQISSHVIAMDVNQGPVDRARGNILKYGYQEKIETRKSDGLDQLKPREADTLLIAGMGGALTVRILQAHKEVVESVRELVLQPQSQIYLVRELMERIGFLITKENMIYEDGKYYVMMKAEAKVMVAEANGFELENRVHFSFGRLLLEQHNPLLLEFLKKEYKRCSQILRTLSVKQTNQTLLREKEITDEIGLIMKGLSYFE